MGYPDFSSGEVLTSADMDRVGLWRITGGTQSGSTALNVDGCFTSSFRNYRLVMSSVQVDTVGRALRFNYRASGSTDANANYRYAYRGLKVDGTTNDTSNAGATFAEIGIYLDSFASTDFGSCTIDILTPQLSTRTHALAAAQGYEGNYYYRNGGFVYATNAAFDGFRISLSGSGNVQFTYQVYGYNSL